MNGHNYTAEQLDFLRRYCRNYTDRELVHLFHAMFGVRLTLDQVKSTRFRHKMLTGRDGCFKPGNVPHPLAGAKGPNKTSFKPGNKPVNWRPVGSERVSKDGIVEVKIADPGTWRSKHRVLWEQHHGRQVPKGHIVVFADGNRRNFDIDNLVLISRRENVVFNKRGYSDADEQVRPTLYQVVRLDCRVNDLSDGS